MLSKLAFSRKLNVLKTYLRIQARGLPSLVEVDNIEGGVDFSELFRQLSLYIGVVFEGFEKLFGWTVKSQGRYMRQQRSKIGGLATSMGGRQEDNGSCRSFYAMMPFRVCMRRYKSLHRVLACMSDGLERCFYLLYHDTPQ